MPETFEALDLPPYERRCHVHQVFDAQIASTSGPRAVAVVAFVAFFVFPHLLVIVAKSK